MNEKTRNHQYNERDDETVARLVALAGERPAIESQIEMRVRDRVEDEWRKATSKPDGARVYSIVHRAWSFGRRPVRRRWMLPIALATAAVLAVAVVMQPPPPADAIAPVGSVAKVLGGSGAAGLPAAGDSLFPGQSLATGPGQGISVSLRNAESLRLDENTTLVVEDSSRFRLVRGRLYADTGGLIYRQDQLVIDTASGRVTDVGTQFSVESRRDLLDVAVREGRVDVARVSGTVVAVAGERVRLDKDEAPVVNALAPDDEFWNWTQPLAPDFDIENRSLLDFLRWAARETGLELEFQDNELRMQAMRTDLHGSVQGFTPLEAVESVLATTSFGYRVEPGRIIVIR